jgi:fumarate reductase flavoprotein subunit
MMGGIHTDAQGATSLAGLYAAGEAACVSINGANRLGSNSLTECLVFGARSGRAAAAFAAEHPDLYGFPQSQARDEERRLRGEFFDRPAGKESIAQIRSEMQNVMEKSAGIYRDGKTLEKAASDLRGLQERYRSISLEDHSNSFNTNWISALELGFMLDVAESIIQSAAQRKESRGSHQRTDFPARDDVNYLKHSLAYRREAETPRIENAPVIITRWPPGERIYGR